MRLAIRQQNLIVRNSLSNAIITVTSATLILVYFSGAMNPWVFGVWYCVMMGYAAISLGLWHRFKDAPVPEAVSGRFIARSEQIAALIGFCWSIIVFAIEGAGEEAITFFVLLCAGKAAAFSSMSGQVPRVTLRFCLGCIVPVVVAALVVDHPHAMFMATLGATFVLVLQKGAIGSFAQLQTVMEEQLRAETAQADLTDALETINDAFAVYGEDGRLERSNSRFQEWFPKGWDLDPDKLSGEYRLSDGRWIMHSANARPGGGWVSVHTDISRMKARERELVVARRDAEEASAAKGRFLSTMSHELRTPLNIINGFSRLLKSDSQVALREETVREYGDSIHHAGEHLLKVINDIIEFSKSGNDSYAYDPTRVAPRELLASAVTLALGFNNMTTLNGVSVSVSPALHDIVVDEMAIRRVLINLISNAFKFSGHPLDVTIRAFVRDDGCPVFSVRDAGQGLSAEEVEHVFAPFYQCDRHRGGEFSGTGLGLTISRQLARLHEGDIVLRSALGKGTTVSLVLPAKTHIQTAEPADMLLLDRPAPQRKSTKPRAA